MAFELIVLNEKTEDLSMVKVVKDFGIFDAYYLFDDYYLVFIDDEAVIATLEPSRFMAGKFEIVSEVLAFQATEEIENLISFADQISAADMIRFIHLYGVSL